MFSKENYNTIDGDWKGVFRFRKIVPEDSDTVCEHLADNFFRDEITCDLLGGSAELAENFNKITRHVMEKDGLSFLCEHIPTGKIAGALIIADHKPDTSYDHINLEVEESKLLLKYVCDAEDLADVPGKYGTASWADFFMASVDKEFREQGICGELCDRAIAYLRGTGSFHHGLIIGTSPWTRRVAEKRGFLPLATLAHRDFVDFEGKSTFAPDAAGGHYGEVMLKML